VAAEATLLAPVRLRRLRSCVVLWRGLLSDRSTSSSCLQPIPRPLLLPLLRAAAPSSAPSAARALPAASSAPSAAPPCKTPSAVRRRRHLSSLPARAKPDTDPTHVLSFGLQATGVSPVQVVAESEGPVGEAADDTEHCYPRPPLPPPTRRSPVVCTKTIAFGPTRKRTHDTTRHDTRQNGRGGFIRL
jgi:hypothetical protein